jgi:hypothetical protein
MNNEVQIAVDGLLRENEEAQKAHRAMLQRGVSGKEAEAEIGRALLACMWEVKNGIPNRLSAVFDALANGKSCVQLFPDDKYEVNRSATH